MRLNFNLTRAAVRLLYICFYTGLLHSETQYNYLAACDMPLITTDYLQFLRRQSLGYDVLVPKHDGYLNPLAGQ